MSVPDLKYEFHDSNIASVQIGPRREATLVIDLYPIFYPDRTTVRVRFGGIFNFEKVKACLDAVEREKDDPDAYLARIESLQFDTKKRSSSDDLYLYLKLDFQDGFRIHCQHLSIEECSLTTGCS